MRTKILLACFSFLTASFFFITSVTAQTYVVSISGSNATCKGANNGSASVFVSQSGQAGYHIAGGGGGWYGGGSAYAAGAGGGSSYYGGAGVTNGSTTAGVNNGNGNLTLSYNSTSITYNYIGAVQTFVVPGGVSSIHIVANGAVGGESWACGNVYDWDGGLGGRTTADIAVTPGQTLYIYVGGKGTGPQADNTDNNGGWNGGGDGNLYAGGGGGATDIRTALDNLSSRLIVAGGGGGGNTGCPNHGTGGPGGGLTGGDGISLQWAVAGTGGTASAGGIAGTNGKNGGFGYGGEYIQVQNPTVLWSTGSTLPSISGLAPGTYTCDVTEPGGYVHHKSITITEPATGLTVSAIVGAASSGNNGSVDLTVSGGTAPYTFVWTGPSAFSASTEDVSGLAEGTYHVTIFDNGTCSNTQTYLIEAASSSPPTISAISTQMACQASDLAAINITIGDVESAAATLLLSGSSSNTSLIPNSNITFGGTGADRTILLSPNSGINGSSTITITVTDGDGMTASSSFTYTVNPVGQVNQPLNQVVCNNGNTTAVVFSTVNSGGTTTYNWTCDTPSIGIAASGTGDIASFTAVNTGTAPVTATIVVTPTFMGGAPPDRPALRPATILTAGADCAGSPVTFTITVNPAANIDIIADTVVCAGSTLSHVFTTTNTGGTTTYAWTNDNTAVGLAASGAGNISAFQATNTGSTSISAVITVTPTFSNGGTDCAGTSTSFTIMVNPKPNMGVVTNKIICAGSPTGNIDFTGDLSGTVFDWTNDNNTIGLASSGTGSIFSFNGINTGNTPVVANISVTPSLSTIVAATFIECNSYTGDDRGGIVATQNYIYLTGDAATARFNHDLTGGVSTGVMRDAIFSDISGAGTVYTFANGGSPMNGGSGTATQIIALDANLAPSGSAITLSTSLSLQGGSSLFSGKGYLIFYASATDHFYRISLPGGVVTDMGVSPVAGFSSMPYTTECWGRWGYSEFTGSVYSVIFRNSLNNNLESLNLNSGVITVLKSFTYLSDMANIVLSPWDNRVYVHWEGGTQWGGYDESIGYLPYSFGSTATTCTGDPVNFTITINPTATVNAVADKVACNNGTVAAINFSSPATGGTIVYNWTNNQPSIGLAASGTGNIAAFTSTNTGTAPVVATITVTPVFTNAGVSCTGTPLSFNITVNPDGQVNQPVSQVVCNQSNTAAYIFTTVNTVGVTLYGWNNSSTSIGLSASGGGNIPSFTAVNNGTAPVTANLSVNGTFNNANAGCGGPFKNFTITVNPTAQVNQPVDLILCNNEIAGITSAVSFGTINTGGTTTYAWTNTNNAIGIPSSGTGDIAAFTAVNTGTVPVTATIVVTPTFTNGGMSCSGPSKTFTITVNPTAQVNQTGSEAVCAGGTWWTAFSTVNTGGTTTYSWVNNNIAIGLPASGTGIVPPFTTTNNGINPLIATITVTPTYTNGGISCSGPSKSFTLTVMPYPTVNQPENQVICNGANTTGIVFDNGSAATPFYYNWTNTASSIGLASSGTGDIVSFTAINTGTSPVTATIVVTPWYSNGAISCSGDPKTFTIVVNPTAQVSNTADQVICNGSGTTAVTFSTVNTGGTATYAWTNDQPSIGLAASGTGNIASFTTVNNGTTPVTATITVTPSFNNAGVTCSGPVKTFTITVNPTAQVNQPVSQVICFSSAANATEFGTLNSGGTTTYAWTNDNTSIGLAASGSGDIAGFNVVNTGTTPQVATVTVTPTFANGGTNCTGPAKTFTITVYPQAQTSQPANQVVCNGSGTSAVTFGTPVTGITVNYNWVNDNPSIGLAANGSGNLASFTAVNSGLAPVTATITVTPVIINGASSCEGPAKSFTITVNPTASVNQPANLVHCTDIGTDPVIFSTDRTGGVTTYTWTNSNPSIGLPASGTGNVPSFIAVNTGLVPVVGIITVTPTFTNGGVSCSGPVKTFTITINPMPTIVCPANITVSNDPGVCGAVVNYPAVVVTGTPTPVVTYSIPAGYLFPIGTTTVTATATNICNTVTCSFTVTVVDNEAPVLTVPANITVTASGVCTSVVNYAVTATDNCPGVVLTRIAGPASGSAFPIGVTTVTYSATDAYSHTVTRSFTVTVLDGQIPAITAQPVNTTVCETATASFRVTATNAVSYQWQTWNGSAWSNMPGITTAVNTLPNTNTGMNTNSYRVQVNGVCMNIVSGYATLYVNSLPQVSIASTAGMVTAPGGTFSIQATVNHTGGTYAWYKNDVLISTGPESSLTNLGVDDAGTYKVVYTDLSGCTATSASLEVKTETLSNIYLYPNPGNGLFNVRIFSQQPDVATLRIFDRKSALVYQRTLPISVPSTTLEINLPALGIRSAGVYVVEIRYQNNPKVDRRQVIVAN